MWNVLGWLGRNKLKQARTIRRKQLQLEALEDRMVPAVFNVNSTADILSPPAGVVTLRSAIEAANATPGNNTINLTVPGTYNITIAGRGELNNGTGDFDILPTSTATSTATLTIQNTSHGAVVVNGNHLDRVFDINPTNSTPPKKFSVVMQGFTVTGGVASSGDTLAATGGGILDLGPVNLSLTNMIVTGNRATADGGGVAMGNDHNTPWLLSVTDSIISNNSAGDAGGGIDSDGSGKVVITGSTISNNTDLNQGAGVYIDAIQDANGNFISATTNITNSIITGNKALSPTITGSGGGISNAGTATITIANSTISHNFAGGDGAGFSDENNVGTLVVLNSLFLDNTALGDGGAIQEGGPNTTITNSEFDGNIAGGNGGALFANGATLNIQSSTFHNNLANGNGGAIELETTGTGLFHGSQITNSTIFDNSAVNNSSSAKGGGIDLSPAFTGDLKLLNDTIDANFASNGGGLFWAGAGNVGVQNTIIAANAADVAPDVSTNTLTGTFIDLGGNVIGVAGAGSGNNVFTNPATKTGSVASPLDPMLDVLQDNGGPIVGAPDAAMRLQTQALLTGSPAIRTGVATGAPTVDERGYPRGVDGTIDAGAFESAKAPPHHKKHKEM